MAEEATKTPPAIPLELGRFTLEPLSHAMAAGSRQALTQGVPIHELIEMHLNHLASVAAMVEPAAAREILIRDLVGAFAGMVKKHVDVRLTTPGGIVLPGAGT